MADSGLRSQASGTKCIKIATALVLTAMLLDTSLVISAPLSHESLSHSPSQQPGGATPLALLVTPAGAWSFADGRYLSANMTTRGEIMAFILTNPGVYLREISEDLGLSMGAVQYHTWVLTKNGEVEECRGRRYRRFFGAGRYQGEERLIISLLRQRTTGRILAILARNEALTHMTLARALGLSSQAVSWQMKRLKETGIVEISAVQGQQERRYRLLDTVVPVVRSFATQKSRTEVNSVPVSPLTP